MKRIGIVAVSAAAGVLLVGGAAYGIGALTSAPEPANTPATVVISDPSPSPTPTDSDSPGAVSADVETTPMPEPQPGPVKCPAGTQAGAVDADGNESNCQETNGQGQQCAAYDDNNHCTQWYKP